MIDAAIVGLGRWGRTLVEAVQGKSGRLRFTDVVGRDPRPASRLCRTTPHHALRLRAITEAVK
jgi:hypothetical protein